MSAKPAKTNIFKSTRKANGWTCRLRFMDEARGERHFDTEWAVHSGALGVGTFTLCGTMNYRGFINHKSIDADLKQLAAALKPGDAVTVQPIRHNMRGKHYDVGSRMIYVTAFELVGDPGYLQLRIDYTDRKPEPTKAPNPEKPKAPRGYSKPPKTPRFVCKFDERTNVYEQMHGNFNYVLGMVVDNEVWLDDGGNVYTVYTKDDTCKRGEYAEELDIQISKRRKGTTAHVKRIAEGVLQAEYEAGLRVSRVVGPRVGLFT